GSGFPKPFNGNTSGFSSITGIGSRGEGSACFLAEDEGFSEEGKSFSVQLFEGCRSYGIDRKQL
ncbi:MAG: hypothetical protein IKS81_02265, partial [Verrucomicrobia bacterium]|nr:hypothetical protein [Verrucomicrobiota bacterium]